MAAEVEVGVARTAARQSQGAVCAENPSSCAAHHHKGPFLGPSLRILHRRAGSPAVNHLGLNPARPLLAETWARNPSSASLSSAVKGNHVAQHEARQVRAAEGVGHPLVHRCAVAVTFF